MVAGIISVTLLFNDACADGYRLIPSISVREEYNDNVFFVSDQDSNTDDFITTISPRLKFEQKTERLAAQVLGRVDFLLYGQNDDLNTEDQFYNGDINYQLTSRLTTNAEAGYIRDSRRDRDIETTGLVLNNSKRDRQHYNLGAEYDLTDISSTGLSYTYDQDDYDDERLIDFESHNASFNFVRDLSEFVPRTSGHVNLGYTQFDFNDSEIDTSSFTLGATYQLTELSSVIVDIGGNYYESTFDSIDTEDEDWLPTGKVSLIYRGERTNVDLGLVQDIQAASGREGVTNRTVLQIDVGRRVTEELRLGIAAGYYWNKADEGELAIRNIDEQTFRVQPSVRYEITKNLSLETAYRYVKIDDKDNNLDRTRNLVFLRFSMQYPLFE